MRRRDAGLSIAVGLLLLAYITFAGSGTMNPIGRFIERTALGYWYIGAAATVATLTLRLVHRWPGAGRVLGLIGIPWITFIVGYGALLFILLIVFGPMGY